MEPNIPAAVRILPMGDDPEFHGKDIAWVQNEFFLWRLLARKEPGKYLYGKSGMAAKQGTVILFQFKSHIVASAILNGVKKFNRPEIEFGREYKGAYCLYPESISTFNPVPAEQIKEIWPQEFERFLG